jgi:hypothetical protein
MDNSGNYLVSSKQRPETYSSSSADRTLESRDDFQRRFRRGANDEDQDEDDSQSEPTTQSKDNVRRHAPLSTLGGFARLQARFLEQEKSDIGVTKKLSVSAQSILQSLLKKYHQLGDDENTILFPQNRKQDRYRLIEMGMSEEEILSLAKEHKLSFLGSILQQFEITEDPISARTLIKSCCLAVPPGCVPACMDAKEITMAALHFLSLNVFDGQPLIRAFHGVSDLEKRQYKKAGAWKLESIFNHVVDELEKVFLSDTSSTKWIPRLYLAPSQSDGRDTLLLKGVVPITLMGKRKTIRYSKISSAVAPSRSSKKTKVASKPAITSVVEASRSPWPDVENSSGPDDEINTDDPNRMGEEEDDTVENDGPDEHDNGDDDDNESGPMF